MLDPTGISSNVAAYLYPNCCEYVGMREEPTPVWCLPCFIVATSSNIHTAVCVFFSSLNKIGTLRRVPTSRVKRSAGTKRSWRGARRSWLKRRRRRRRRPRSNPARRGRRGPKKTRKSKNASRGSRKRTQINSPRSRRGR